MSKAPIHSFTVCEGRETLGFIQEMEDHQYAAQLFAGKKLGLFPSKGSAAQAINEGHKAIANGAGG
jgi:hypothetical protein